MGRQRLQLSDAVRQLNTQTRPSGLGCSKPAAECMMTPEKQQKHNISILLLLLLLPTSFANLSHHRFPSNLRTDSTDFTTGPFLLSISVFVFFLVSSLLFLFVWAPCGRLSWLLVSFWAHVNIVHRIISYHNYYYYYYYYYYFRLTAIFQVNLSKPVPCRVPLFHLFWKITSTD